MKSEQLDFPKNKPRIRGVPKPFKFFLIVLVGMVLLVSLFVVGSFVYCNTVAICEGARPTMSPEMRATQMPIQYESALQDIEAGRYENARQRLKYIIAVAPEFPGAKEKLVEVENLLQLTPSP